MNQVISAREYRLSQVVFGDERIKSAKKKSDPVSWLTRQIENMAGGFDDGGIYPGCYGYQVLDGMVNCLGKGDDGRLNFDKPIYQISLERLAHVALAGMFQISFLDMVQQ